MDLKLPEEVQGQLQTFEELLSGLESTLKPFTAPDSAAAIAQLDALPRAQVQLALAQAAYTLLQLYLRAAAGADPADHSTSKEQERLSQYSKKVRKAVSARDLSQSKRSLEVNVAAVNRFIAAAVPDLSGQQKAALKQAAAGRKRQGGAGGGGEEPPGEEGGGDAEDAAAAFLQQTMAELQGQQQSLDAEGQQPASARKKKKSRK